MMDDKEPLDTSSKAGIISDNNEKNPNAKSISSVLTPLELAFKTMLVCPTRSGEVRIAEEYRPMFNSLTLRQLKSFLRERLFNGPNSAMNTRRKAMVLSLPLSGIGDAMPLTA